MVDTYGMYLPARQGNCPELTRDEEHCNLGPSIHSMLKQAAVSVHECVHVGIPQPSATLVLIPNSFISITQ